LVGLDSQREVLPRPGGREWSAVRILEPDGDHRVAFGCDRADSQPTESRPGGRRARNCQPGVATVRFSFEQGSKRGLPAGTEGRDPERSEQLLSRMPREVEQRIHLGDNHALGTRRQLYDLVPGLHVALLEYAEVEARAVVGDEQGGDARIIHANPDPVAGHARLRDLKYGRPNPVAVADADLIVGEPLDREVLAELPVDEVASPELAFPVPVGLDLVDEHGALLATVAREIALTVPLDVQLTHVARTADRILEDAREHSPPLPGHIPRHADVHGNEPPHLVSAGVD
jgi:hypothetical protein